MKLFGNPPSNAESDAIYEDVEDECGRKWVHISFPGSEKDVEIILVHERLKSFQACLEKALTDYKLTRSNDTPIFVELKEKFLALPESSRQKILNQIIGRDYLEDVFQHLIPVDPETGLRLRK